MSDYIPPELIPNILVRLPLDDVLRCMSVCKSWYSLITCPSFASSHLNLSPPNQEPRLLITYCKYQNYRLNYCLHRDNQTFDEIAELDVPISGWQIIDSLNGLVCLYDCVKGRITLWNPSLRKSLILPNSKGLSDSQVTYHPTVGFGFVATSNEYKILKFSYAFETVPQAEVYELRTGSWHDVKLEDSVGYCLIYDQAHLNGILHWSARINQGQVNPNFSNFICSFDLKNEKYGTLMVPSCLRHGDDDDDVVANWNSFLSTFKESLCLIEYGRDKLCRIWVMKEYGVADSWQKMFIIDTQQHSLANLLCFRHNGEIGFENVCRSSGKRKLVSYDCKENRVKNDELLANCVFTSVYTYVESLFLIKSPNEVKIDEESTNIS